jgi:hypothetical protein
MDDEMKDFEMGRACGMYEREVKYIELWWGNWRPRVRHRSGCKDNIKTDRKEYKLNVSIGMICFGIGKVAGWRESCYYISCPLKCG